MFKILRTKTNTIGKTALILTIFSISSSILAVVRDKIFSTQFGAGEVLDTYMAAFKIPDMVFLLTATLISSFVIIPLFEKEDKKGRQFLQDFIDKLFFSFSFFILVIAGIVFALAPWIAQSFFSGFHPEQLDLLVSYSRVLLLSPILMGLSFVFMGLNQKNSYFFPVALTGIFYNLSIIFGILVLYPIFGFWGIIFGVVIGAMIYFLLQLPPVISEKYFLKKFQLFSFGDFLKILKIATPRSIALAISDFLIIFLIAQATFFGSGSVTMLNFSLNIFAVPLTIIAVSYSIAVFPKLAKSFAENKLDELKDMSRDVISRILFFAIPISFFFIVFSDILVGFLLGSSKFAIPEITSTALFVSAFSFGIVFQAVSIMIIRIFYAMGKTWVPLFVNMATAILMIFLVFYFQKISFIENLMTLFGKNNLSEQTVSILNLSFAYTLAFIFGAFLTKYTFAKTVKAFSLLKDSNLYVKILISLISIIFAKFIYNIFIPSLTNSFFFFTKGLLISGTAFLFAFIILSEIFKDKNYLELKRKVLFHFKKAIIKLWK